MVCRPGDHPPHAEVLAMTAIKFIEAGDIIVVTYWLKQWNNVGDQNTGICVEYGDPTWPSWSYMIVYTEMPEPH